MQTAYYIQAIPSVFLWDTKRKDRVEMTIHHVVTIILILYSFTVNFTRIGVMIMLLHDVCDIFMEIAKLFRLNSTFILIF